MTNHNAWRRALDGEPMEHIPFGIYANFIAENPDPLWYELIAAGLTVIDEAPTFRETQHGVEVVRRAEPWRDEVGERLTLRTAQGEISQLTVRGWVQEYYLKTPDDYRVLAHLVRSTETFPDPAPFLAKEAGLGQDGFTFLVLGRTPLQTILVDWAGLENFSAHLAAGFPELWELADALLQQLLMRCRCIAAGPGRHVSLLENLTADQWGPRRFAQYHLPIYEQITAILHPAGQQVHAHMDGQLRCLAPLIARSGLDGIESLTGPPEGDMTYAQARAAWPGMMLWGNVNVGLYDLPPAALRATLQRLAHEAAPDGRRLVLQVSEDLPPNWRQALPFVLDVLAETRTPV